VEHIFERSSPPRRTARAPAWLATVHASSPSTGAGSKSRARSARAARSACTCRKQRGPVTPNANNLRGPPRGNERIMVVEDEATVRAVAVQCCASSLSGHRGRERERGVGGLERVAGGVDLVFTDMVMPGPLWVDLCQRLRQLKPDVRTVITSGYSAGLGDLSVQRWVFCQNPTMSRSSRGRSATASTPRFRLRPPADSRRRPHSLQPSANHSTVAPIPAASVVCGCQWSSRAHG